MKRIFILFGIPFFLSIFSGQFADDYSAFAEFPPRPSGCCKQRDWLAADWRETNLGFEECEILNQNRDNLEDIFEEKGYVWWDSNCDR